MLYVGAYDCCENIKIKLSSTINILKPWHGRNVWLQIKSRGGSLRKFLGSKEHLDWLKIDLNVAKISTVKYYRHTKNSFQWKYTYVVLKLGVKQVTYKSRHNGNTKRTNLKENQLDILKIYAFCQKYSRGPWVQERALLALCMRIHPESCCIFPLKVEVTLLSGSRKGTIGA